MNLQQLFEQADIHKTNLDALYRDLNKKYFNGQLPIVKTKWTNTRTKGGSVKALHYKKEDRIEIKFLEISNHTVMDKDRLYGLMMHEMIHVFVLGILQMNEPNGGHGFNFMMKHKELQQITPFDIPLTDDISNAEISSHVKVKPTVVVDMKGRGITAFTEKALMGEDAIKKMIERISYFSKDFSIYIADSNVLSKVTIKRAMSGKYPIYKLNDGDMKQIKDSISKVLVTVKNGEIV